jgi:predicted DCC family thiol-disulfide oxidoreductase YuxK
MESDRRTDPDHHGLLLFDGQCGFCDGFVRFVVKRDREAALRYAPLQSPAAQRLLGELGTSPAELPDSLVYISGGRLAVRSAAGLGVLSQLGGPWRGVARLMGLVPAIVRDTAYDLFARSRYRLSGRRARCSLPPAEIRARFLWD